MYQPYISCIFVKMFLLLVIYCAIITSGSRPVTQPVRKTEFDHSSSTTSERADSASLEGTHTVAYPGFE